MQDRGHRVPVSGIGTDLTPQRLAGHSDASDKAWGAPSLSSWAVQAAQGVFYEHPMGPGPPLAHTSLQCRSPCCDPGEKGQADSRCLCTLWG